MITPPELRHLAERLSIDAKNAADARERRMLLDLMAKLIDTAAALEQMEQGDAPKIAVAERPTSQPHFSQKVRG
jgi:hypothetical protein